MRRWGNTFKVLPFKILIFNSSKQFMQPQRHIYHPMSNTQGDRWEDKRERHHPASKVTTEMSQLITSTTYRVV